jgi:hypothetical protein
LAVTPTNLEAAEDIRLLLRSSAVDLDLPSYDFWIFDDARLGIMHFDDDGVFHCVEMVADPDIVGAHQDARRRAITLAMPYDQFIVTHPINV